MLFHVIIQKIPNLEDSEVREFYARLDRTARRTMVDLSQALARDLGVEIHLEVAVEQPAAEIVRVAGERHRRSDRAAPSQRGEAPRGSTSYKVRIWAPCSVLLLKGGER